MSNYTGQIAVIPLGTGGLFTDAPHSRIPSSKLVRARNVTLYNGVAEKDYGSRRWNETALATGIVSFLDWFPDPQTQRLIAVGADGKVYRFTNPYNCAEVTPASTAPTTLYTANYVTMLPCGAEETLNDKKIFILTGANPIQVVSADGTTRRDITGPAADWTGARQPFGAIVHRSRVFAWGNDGHTVYASKATDHEDFQSGSAIFFSVYPGEGERIVDGFVFRSRLFIAKYPKGLYILIDDDADPDNWYFTRFSKAFGGSSPQGHCEIMNDLLVGNSQGSISLLSASQKFADFESSNLFNMLQVKRFAATEFAPGAYQGRQGLFYEHKSQAFFTFRSRQGMTNDRIATLQFRADGSTELTVSDKDQATCLSSIRDIFGVERPAYGAPDGFVYLLDQEDRWVGDTGSNRTAYTFEILTKHEDFSSANEIYGEQVKAFEQLEVVYEPTGRWDLLIDVFVDARFVKTMRFQLDGRTQMDELHLDQARLDDGCEFSKLQKLGASGRRIAFRCYNETAGENVRLVKLRVYFQVTGQEQKN